MGKLKNTWNKIPLWLKGGLIGFLVGLLPLFEGTLNMPWLIYLLYPLVLISDNILGLGGQESLMEFFIAPFFWLLIGMLVGFLVNKYKQRKK